MHLSKLFKQAANARKEVITGKQLMRKILPLLVIGSFAAIRGAAAPVVVPAIIDFSQIKSFGEQIVAFVLWLGAIACLIGLVVGVIHLFGRDRERGFMTIVCSLIGGIIIGMGLLWITGITGESVSAVGF